MPWTFIAERFWDWWKERKAKRLAESARVNNDATYDRAVQLIDDQRERITYLETMLDETRARVFDRIAAAESYFDQKWKKVEERYLAIETGYAKCEDDRLLAIRVVAALREQITYLTSQLAKNDQKTQDIADKVEETAAKVESINGNGHSGASTHGGG